ncbi:MAG: hypothetical protein VW701_15735 [Deltaproteobacteria bacterium]
MGIETRYFKDPPKWVGQSPDDFQTSVEGFFEIFYPLDGNHSITINPFFRKDGIDENRDLLDIREGYWLLESDPIEVLVGVNTVFWGVAESINLVDVINQTDSGDFSGDQKLGQPMINLRFLPEYGTFSIYLLPYFRERSFSGPEGRFRGPTEIEKDNSEFESTDALHNLDVALRYSHYFSDVDFGLSYFTGTSREPLILPNSAAELFPYYGQISQLGLDFQYTYVDLLFKTEVVVRDGFSETYTAAVSGFEYTFYQMFDSDSDFSILFEYQHDGRSKQEPQTLADKDIFAGYRITLNDMSDSSFLGGTVYDTSRYNSTTFLEYETRIYENFILQVSVTEFSGAQTSDPSYIFASDDFIQIKLTCYL